MNTKLIGSVVALTLGSTISFNASAALASNAILQFSNGINTCINGGTYPNCTSYSLVTGGSYFALDLNASGTFTRNERVAMTVNEGILLNTTQLAYGNHLGAPDGTESPSIDMPVLNLGGTWMHQTTSPITILTDDNVGHVTLNFSGWGMIWNDSTEAIVLDGNNSYTFPAVDTGIATLTCGSDCSLGDTFSLDYKAHVTSGFLSLNGIYYTVHLEGIVSTVPVPAAVWLFGSGLIGLAGVARRSRLGA